MSLKDFIVDDASAHFAASKSLDYRNGVRERFSVFIKFLQDNALTTRTLLEDDQPPTEATKIYRSDLTEEGYQVVKDAYPKWLKGLDKGKTVGDITVLKKSLEKIRKSPA